MIRKTIILDTDIGTDVDDLLALSLVLTSPELELIGVTTVYGDVALRAQMVCRLLTLRGVSDIPVAMGASKPLLGKRAVYWEGHEGKGLLTPDEKATPLRDEHAVDMIVRTAMARPGEITLVAIGPLTNVALAFLREPRLAQALAGLLIMGGSVGGAVRCICHGRSTISAVTRRPRTSCSRRARRPESCRWMLPCRCASTRPMSRSYSRPGRSVPSGCRRSSGELPELRQARRLDLSARSAAVATAIDSTLVTWQPCVRSSRRAVSIRPGNLRSQCRPAMGSSLPRWQWMWTSNAANVSSLIDSRD